MSFAEAADWPARVRAALTRYPEDYLRAVAGRLVNPRNQWPVDHLRDRMAEALANAPVIDRRLRSLTAESRQALAVLAACRCPSLSVAALVELLAALGSGAGLEPLARLIDEGLVFPDPERSADAPRDAYGWLMRAMTANWHVFTPAEVARRAASEPLPLPELAAADAPRHPGEADGLDWLLRLATLWQEVRDTPLRLTQQGQFFKRDVTRLKANAVIGAPPADGAVEPPDALSLWAAVGRGVGLFESRDGELHVKPFPADWDQPLAAVLGRLWLGVLAVEQWHPIDGWVALEVARPATSAVLLLALCLARAADPGWVHAAALAGALAQRHPQYAGDVSRAAKVVESVAAGLLVPLRVVEFGTTEAGPAYRLSVLGRHLLRNEPAPQLQAEFPQTLLVQPNCEIVVYRQGLDPALVGKLTRFAAWRGAGSACQAELTADSVYAGLESGYTLEGLVTVLNRHGMRKVPDPVLGLLRTWSNKRDRIVVHASAVLIEFASPADLDEAVRRGTVSERLSDTIGLSATGEALDYKHFRVSGNRDYESPPARCLTAGTDGLTLGVDRHTSDLLLNAELARLAEPLAAHNEPVPTRYRLTRASLRGALAAGMTLAQIDEWMTARSGQPLSAAARVLAGANVPAAVTVQARHVVEMADPTAAAGLTQLLENAGESPKLAGPTTMILDDAGLAALRGLLGELGVEAG